MNIQYLHLKFHYLKLYIVYPKRVRIDRHLIGDQYYRKSFGNYINHILFYHIVVQDLCSQLRRFVASLTEYHQSCITEMEETDIFPIEIDLNRALGKSSPNTEIEAQ